MLDLSKPVCFESRGTWHIGEVAKVKNSPHGDNVYHFGEILVRHYHTGDLEFVATESLVNYEVQPEPPCQKP